MMEMLIKSGVNYLRLLSGVYGIASVFLPWLVSEYSGAMTLWYTYPSVPVGQLPPFGRVPLEALTVISVTFAATLAVMILGCMTAFLGSLTPGTRGKWLAVSAGMAFSMSPVVFVLGSTILYANFGSYISRTVFSSSIISSGFFMAFVAAAVAFMSLATLKNVLCYLLTLGSVAAFYLVALAYAWRGPLGPSVFIAFLFSLITASISTLAYGIYRALRKK